MDVEAFSVSCKPNHCSSWADGEHEVWAQGEYKTEAFKLKEAAIRLLHALLISIYSTRL